jgi:hypothetical protein
VLLVLCVIACVRVCMCARTDTIYPNPTRTAWAAPVINEFSSALFQDEYLYPADSQFTVLSATCVSAGTNGNVWSIMLMELDPLSTHRNWLL